MAREAALADLLRRCSPDEGRYAVKLVTGDMRIGLREGLVEEAIGVAFERPAADVARAVMLLGDLGEVACLVARGESVDRPRYFSPLRFMLASPVADAGEAVRRMGDDVWVEDKYDGIRCQLHHRGERVALYSRDLNEVTDQFPEVAEAAAAHTADIILDGEVLAFRDGRVLPFHDLQSRLGRRNPSAAAREAVPVIYVAWDLLRHGRTRFWTPRCASAGAASSRWRSARASRSPTSSRRLARTRSTTRFAAARARRNEGLMLKDPDSAYTPGRRGLAWLKLKRPLDTLDVVVVGAEWGHGKRRGVLSDVTFAVRTDDGELVTVGKAYTGLTDAEIAEMTALLLDITVEDRGHYRTVRPQIVLEVAFDAVHRSSRHRSGYALRFPRIAVLAARQAGGRDRHPRARRRHRGEPGARPRAAGRSRRVTVSAGGEEPGEQLRCVHGGVADLLERAEARSQRRVLRRQRGITVGLGGIPGMQVADLGDAGLEHLFEAAEARLRRGGERGAECLLSEAGGGEDRVLLGVHADADVVRPAAQRRVDVALRTAMAAALAAVGHAEGRPVVPGAHHPALAGDHRTHPPAQAVGTAARRERDQQEVEVLVRARGRPGGCCAHRPTVPRGRRLAARGGRLSAPGRVAQPVRARGS